MAKEPVFDYVGFFFGNLVRVVVICGLGSLLGEVGFAIAAIFCVILIINRWKCDRVKFFLELLEYRATHDITEWRLTEYFGFISFLEMLNAKGQLNSKGLYVLDRSRNFY